MTQPTRPNVKVLLAPGVFVSVGGIDARTMPQLSQRFENSDCAEEIVDAVAEAIQNNINLWESPRPNRYEEGRYVRVKSYLSIDCEQFA